mmetsp:Transcript_25619/g.71583  ORF Transcript_25619/g.71583 Transcript_25619/m.71583 type:complete len:327 (+) Transcript_25619:1770-2750(+)
MDGDDIAHVHLPDFQFDRERARIFHGVEEDRGDLSTQAQSAGLDVWHVRDVVTHEPQDGVGGRFSGRSRSDDISDVRQRMSLLEEFFDLSQRPDLAVNFWHDALAGIFEHGERVQRNVRARPGILRRAQIVGVGFAGDLEDGGGHLLGHLWLFEVPLRVGPAGEDLHGGRVALVGERLDVVECVEDEEGVRELVGRQGGDVLVGVLEQIDQGGHVVPALHGAQQLDGTFTREQVVGFGAGGQCRKPSRLDVRSLVDAWWHAVHQEFLQTVGTGGAGLQVLDGAAGLAGIQRLWRHAESVAHGGTFGDVGVVLLQEAAGRQRSRRCR